MCGELVVMQSSYVLAICRSKLREKDRTESLLEHIEERRLCEKGYSM